MHGGGAIFKIVLRDERFDRYFTASDFLRCRLDAIRLKRKAAGFDNVQPTFLDIEQSHSLFIHSAYRPYVSTASEYVRVKAAGDTVGGLGPGGGALHFTFPIHGHFTSDMVVHIRIGAIGSKTATAPSAATPYLRYCALPGVRMFRKVEMKSDSVLIDDYTPDDVIAHSKFFVHADQRVGWERCHGQQEPREALYYANGYTGRLKYHDGPQTPKLYQEGFDLYIPLQFWICRDSSQALLNDLIPNSQRTITCELAPLADIVQALLPAGGGAGTLMAPADLPFTKVAIDADLYVNNLYVNPEIHDIFASRIGFSLIRVHRRQTIQLRSPSDAFLLDQLRFPAEYLMVGVRARSLAHDFDRWWMMGRPRVRDRHSSIIAPAMIWNDLIGIPQLVSREAVEVTTLDNVVDTIGVTAHGIDIFPQLPSAFYNAYLPIRYSESTMVAAPADTSAFLISFCLYPGKRNPSGYYNLSAGREMYINYQLKPEASEVEGGEFEMTISMSALNFLVRKGDRIALRYAL
jgi:hypothetical protein